MLQIDWKGIISDNLPSWITFYLISIVLKRALHKSQTFNSCHSCSMIHLKVKCLKKIVCFFRNLMIWICLFICVFVYYKCSFYACLKDKYLTVVAFWIPCMRMLYWASRDFHPISVTFCVIFSILCKINACMCLAVV